MSFLRLWSSQPTTSQVEAIEGVDIVANQPQSAVREAASGVVGFIGECLKGAYNTPLEYLPNSIDDFVSQFGGYSPYLGIAAGYAAQGGPNGNLFVNIRNKTFERNIVCRVDMRMVTTSAGTTPATISLTITGAAANTTYTIPAGTRLNAAFIGPVNVVVMPDNDVTFTTNGSGGATVSNVNVTGVSSNVFPGTTATSIPATGVTWTILDTANLPSGLTSGMIAIANATTIYPAPAHATQYQTAINAFATSVSPGADIDTILSTMIGPDTTGSLGGVAWTGGVIPLALYNHCVTMRNNGKARRFVVNGAQGDSPSTAEGGVTSGSSSATSTNLNLANCKAALFGDYAWPWVQEYIEEANATLTVPPAAWLACAQASVNPEQNPGESGIQAFQYWSALETTVAPQVGDYIALREAGIAAFMVDKQTGNEVQSGITVDNVTPTDQKTARFYDNIAMTLGPFAKPFTKKLTTVKRKSAFLKALTTFLDGMVSLKDPDLQRINAYRLDAVSANTTANQAAGIYAVKVAIQMIPGMDFIEFILSVGTNVTIEAAVASSGNPTQ